MKRSVLLLAVGGLMAGVALLSPPGPGVLAPGGPPVLLAQGPRPSLRPPAPAEPPPAAQPHRAGELECRNCHEGKHRGVLLMYLGMGGRGTPMIPSHMFQVRVECVACHIVPKEPGSRAGIVGQTFRPSEQACLGCHGERYRGMLERWTDTLAKMRGAIAPKLEGARAVLAQVGPKHPKHARARRLVDDAGFNVEFVALARGVHNVFYAADLLKLSNGWLDEAFALLGVTPVKTDDALVRGGYCGVLCHEQAGVRLPESVAFGKQKVPHARHVAEFGAVCTACHSPEVHKAVTATAATCTGCHHGPQNDRCEACHRAQSAFYRGEIQTALVKVEPNGMAAAVSCTGCHDFTQRHSRQAVGVKCAACHDAAYLEFLRAWTSGLDRETAGAGDALKRAQAAVAAARRAGRPVPEAEAAAREAREALALVRSARPVHNPAAGEALLEAARRKAEEAAARAGRR